MNTTSLDARLAALPRKVATPLRGLLGVGQIDEEVLNTVLDAADLAGSRDRILGFAVGYLHLQSQQVPVKDTIRMARAQGRRIRLDWSARRWQLEHDRLSRAETLMRLQAENVEYDVSRAEALLPKEFPGYLIRTSRRLGMEGLRQRHCVASYHASMKTGYTFLVAVFIERKRWTVQLSAGWDPQKPLRIVQARTRFNGIAPPEVRQQISQILGIAANPEPGYPDRRSRPHAYMDNLRRVLPVLREHRVTRVTVSFDGGGDDGSIEGVEYSGGSIKGEAVFVEIEELNLRFESDRWVGERTLHTRNLDQAIQTLCDDYLDEVDVNWYDGDGGFGELFIDVEEGTVGLEISNRYTESSVVHASVRDITTGEDID